MNAIDLRSYAMKGTNDDGRRFIGQWITEPITAIVHGSHNFDYIIYGLGRIASIPSKSGEGCRASFFGDLNHLLRLRREGIRAAEYDKLINILTN